jgi:PPOX class probable F420-dependent enzyme
MHMAELTQDQTSFLSEANVAVLASVDRRGRAHAAPVWYLYEDGAIIISTGRGSQKHRNIQANPEITLVVDRRSLPYFALMVQGAAEIGPPLSPDERLRMATRYLGDDLARRYLERTRGEESVTVRLRPRKIIEFNGRAGR